MAIKMDTMTLETLRIYLSEVEPEDVAVINAALDAAIRERDELKRELGAFRGVVMQRLDAQKWEQCAERAEAELAAVKATIAGSHLVLADGHGGVMWPVGHAAFDQPKGRRFRLVVEE